MKRAMRFALAALVAACAAPAILAAGHTHAPANSVWTLNLKASDFGSGPPMKSDVMTILVDTEQRLKWTDAMVDSDDKTWNTSWSGPQDGTLKPLVGMPGAKASFKTADDSSHFVMPDGSTSDSVLTMSDDKKQVTIKITGKMKDGKSFSQTLVYDRTK